MIKSVPSEPPGKLPPQNLGQGKGGSGRHLEPPRGS